MATGNRDFVDLSNTIVTRSAANNNPSENTASTSKGVPANANREREVRERVADGSLTAQKALEERMKLMVQNEMNEIRRSISELSKAVKELSMPRTQAQASTNSVHTTNNRQSNVEATNMHLFNNIIPGNNGNGTEFNPHSEEQLLGSNNTALNNRSNTEKMIRVDKWGIIFNGNNSQMSVEDFIFRIEYLQAHYDITWEEILRDFHLLVTGAAKDWYWLLVRTHGALKWPTLKNELRNQYRINISNFEIMRDLVERRQQPNESIDTFFFEMSKLRSRLMQPIPECDMIKIMKRNVRENIARIVYPITVSSVEQLRMECQEAERNIPRRDIRNNYQQRITRNINEVSYENCGEEDEEVEVAAAKIVTPKNTLVCWNCKEQGHGFRDCNAPERTLFCYRCGKPEVIAPKCPDCRQENRLKDVGRAGDLRPAKNHN